MALDRGKRGRNYRKQGGKRSALWGSEGYTPKQKRRAIKKIRIKQKRGGLFS